MSPVAPRRPSCRMRAVRVPPIWILGVVVAASVFAQDAGAPVAEQKPAVDPKPAAAPTPAPPVPRNPSPREHAHSHGPPADATEQELILFGARKFFNGLLLADARSAVEAS